MGSKHSKVVSVPINLAATPSAEESEIFENLNSTSSQSGEVLDKMASYRAKENEIRAAIATPSPETEEAAWKAIIPQVQTINSFFEYSRGLKGSFAKGVQFLCKMNGNDSVSRYQATTVRMMEMINFAVQFDTKKLTNPGLQNDFSYYRRSVGKMKLKHHDDVFLRDDITNQISMFFAFAAPMILCLSDTLSEEVKNGVNLEFLSDWLRTVAHSCCSAVTGKSEQAVKKMRVMTGCILLYDTVVPTGAFNTKGKFNVIDCIRALTSYQGEKDEVDSLVNSLKYSTKHFNDSDTPKNVKVLLL